MELDNNLVEIAYQRSSRKSSSISQEEKAENEAEGAHLIKSGKY